MKALAIVVLLVACRHRVAPPAVACDDEWPAWSPDGRRIVFASTRTGDHEIYVLRLGERVARRLTNARGRDAHPAFSPDGTMIAFQSPREGDHTNLYLMNDDGSDQRRITGHRGFAGMPVWSPDGTQLAYQWRPERDAERWRLMLLPLATGATPRELTSGDANDQIVNWAPDGARLVFNSDRTGRDQLYLYALADGVVTPLPASDAERHAATWSPDGSLLAFKSGGDDPDRAATFVMPVDGSAPPRQVGGVAGHGVPFFSPDGTRVVVSPMTPRGREIRALDLASGIATTLTACTAAP